MLMSEKDQYQRCPRRIADELKGAACRLRKIHGEAAVEFSEFTGPGIDLNRPAMLLDDNVLAQRETMGDPHPPWRGFFFLAASP
jgi:hypothetical protein